MSSSDEHVISSTQLLAHAAAAATQLIFAGWNILGTLALRDSADPMGLILIRQFGSGAVLALVAVSQSQLVFPEPPHLATIMWFGFIGGCVMPVCFTYGLQLTTPTIGSIFDGPLMPVSTSAIALACGIESLAQGRKGQQQLGSIALAVISAIVLVLNTRHPSSPSTAPHTFAFGCLLLVIESMAMAAVLILQKPLLEHYSGALTLFWVNIIGACFNTILVTFGEEGGLPRVFSDLLMGQHSPIILIAIAYLVLVEGPIAFGLISYANSKLPSSSVALYACGQPVFTCILTYLLLGETVNPLQAAGAIGVIAGLWLNIATATSNDTVTEYAAVSSEGIDAEYDIEL